MKSSMISFVYRLECNVCRSFDLFTGILLARNRTINATT